MGVPVRVLATTRLKPIVFWEGYPGLWEFLPGTPETPPALRARPPVGGAAPLVAVAAVERQPLRTPAQMEVAYIRRLYTFLLTRTGGAETGDFLRQVQRRRGAASRRQGRAAASSSIVRVSGNEGHSSTARRPQSPRMRQQGPVAMLPRSAHLGKPPIRLCRGA